MMPLGQTFIMGRRRPRPTPRAVIVAPAVPSLGYLLGVGLAVWEAVEDARAHRRRERHELLLGLADTLLLAAFKRASRP